jgi:hypothetical protein
MSVSSSLKAMTFGNIIFGGLIGIGVDAATGAACQYPAVIPVMMDCGKEAVSSEIAAHEIPDHIGELAEKLSCDNLIFVGQGPENSLVYSANCEAKEALLTCDDKACAMSEIKRNT